METSLPTPTTARVYVNIPEGCIYIHHIHTINPQVNLEFETKLAMGHHLVGINHEWVDILCYHKDIMGIYWDIYIDIMWVYQGDTLASSWEYISFRGDIM